MAMPTAAGPPSLEEIADFVREQTRYRGDLSAATLLQVDIGVDADDMSDFIREYSRRFGVDVSNYRWYFHSGEEGFGVGGLFFDPPYQRVAHIPITLGMLHQFATLHRWAVEYPPHEIPKRRYDAWINLAVAGLVLGAVAVFLFRGCVR